MARGSRTHVSLIQDFKQLSPFFFHYLQENVRFCNNPLQLFFKIFYKSHINNLSRFSQATSLSRQEPRSKTGHLPKKTQNKTSIYNFKILLSGIF